MLKWTQEINYPGNNLFFLPGTNGHAKETCYHDLYSSSYNGISPTDNRKLVKNLTDSIHFDKGAHSVLS